MKNHNKKRALFSSIISLILCVTMLLGTTFAWFTSSVSNTGNRIRTGELGVALYKYNAEEGGYKDISDGTGDIFTDSGENGTLWEPNRTEIVFLEVRNTKSLALNYNLILDVTADTANEAKLEDVLSYAILPGVTGDAFDWNQFTCWDDVLDAASGVETGTVPAGQTTAAPNGALEAGESDFFALAVHMDKEAGNEYQDCGITIDVQVMARQMASEYDNFGNQYDADSLFTEQEPAVPPKTVDILDGRGDMEEGNQLEFWAYRNTQRNCHGLFEFISDDATGSLDGTTYLKLTPTEQCAWASCNSSYAQHDAEQSADVGISNIKNLLIPGRSYTMKAWIKQEAAEATLFKLVEKVNGTNQTTEFSVQANAVNRWEEVTWEFTTDPNSTEGSYTFNIWTNVGGQSVCVDNVRIYATEELTETTIQKLEFQAMLAAENAESMQVIVDDGDPTVWKEAVENSPANYLVNSTFDTNVESWGVNSKTTTDMYSWVSDNNGGGYIKINNTTTKAAPAVGQVADNMMAGAEYQISFKYMIEPTNEVTTPFVDIECFAYTDEPGDTGHLGGLELRFNPDEFIKDGDWHDYSYRVRVPLRTDYAQIWIRHTANDTNTWENPAYGAVYYDDVTFTMTNTSNVISLNDNMKFFYSDMDSTEFEATVQTKYYEDYADGSVVFEVYDGQNSVYKSEAIALSDSVAKVAFDLGTLQKIDSPYCVKATLYDEGVEKAATSKNIYIYDRPAAIDENGEYVKFGKDFIPVLGYHVYEVEGEDHFSKLLEAGINVVQVPNDVGKDVDKLLAYLDKLDALGLKGMVCLYSGMMPAGNEANMETTIRVVSNEKVRNHHALFGYNISDEPFIYQLDPKQDLENSYRLIRQYDKDNAIMFVEDLEMYIPISSSYADALILDPYFDAADAEVYQIVKTATEEINFKKPLWIVLSTYVHNDGHFNTGDDARNNNYQALLAGIDSLGYFSISDPGNLYADVLIKADSSWEGFVHVKSEGYIPVWNVKTPSNANAGAELWAAMSSFAEDEKAIVGAHFISNKGTKLIENINIADGYMYYSWAAEDGKIYLVVLDVKGDDVTVDIPLKEADGSDMGAYTAKFIAGRDAEDISGSGNMNITLTNVESLLFEITAN